MLKSHGIEQYKPLKETDFMSRLKEALEHNWAKLHGVNVYQPGGIERWYLPHLLNIQRSNLDEMELARNYKENSHKLNAKVRAQILKRMMDVKTLTDEEIRLLSEYNAFTLLFLPEGFDNDVQSAPFYESISTVNQEWILDWMTRRTNFNLGLSTKTPLIYKFGGIVHTLPNAMFSITGFGMFNESLVHEVVHSPAQTFTVLESMNTLRLDFTHPTMASGVLHLQPQEEGYRYKWGFMYPNTHEPYADFHGSYFEETQETILNILNS